MIKVISRRVLIMIALLAAICGGAGYGLYEYLIPMRAEKEAQVAKVQSEIESKRREVAKLKEEFILLQIQLRKFKDLEANGFFNNQNRVKAQESFDDLRKLSGLLKTRYVINSGSLVDIKQASEANYVVLRSPVVLEIDSLDDVDVFTFIKGLQEKFPGSVDMTKIMVTRLEPLGPEVLRKIGSGEPVKLVTAKVEFDWRTMANYDRLNESDTSSTSSSSGSDILPTVEPVVPNAVQTNVAPPASSVPPQPSSAATQSQVAQ